MAIPLPEAVFLGVVQGIAEFLPISSDGHLALLQMLVGGEADAWAGGQPQTPAATFFLRIGTISAAILILRKRVMSSLTEGLRGVVRPSLLKDTQGGRDAVTVALATIPTVVVGLALKGASEGWSSSPTLVGACFLGSALAIGSTHWAPKGDKDTPSSLGAILVGVAQGAAVLPGLSRTGMALATLLWLGMRSERAFELAFLMSLPALCGAELVAAPHAFHGDDGIPALIVGACVAFVVGLGALQLLRGIVARRVVAPFAVYLVPLGLATLAWGYARP